VENQSVLNIMSVCVSILVSVLSSAPCYIAMCDLSGSTIFFHIIIKLQKLLNIKCVFRFSLQLFSEIYLILRRIQHDINLSRPFCKVPVILVVF
jgi:hypothetical protein